MANLVPDCAPLVEHLHQRLGDDLVGVYLYGSFARGDARSESDVDVAILGSRPVPKETLHRLTVELVELCGRDVDLVDLRQVPTVLAMQVISTGKRLFCRDQFACELFETHVFSDYVDLNERRAEILKDIKSRGSVYG